MTELETEDVLSPPTVWVDESCYRVNRKESPSKVFQTPPVPQPYTDNEEILRCDELNSCDVEITENGRFKTFIRLPQAFFSYIIGTKGSRRKRLEEETKTDIVIPRGSKNNIIVITGSSERSVVLARQRLEMIGIDLRNRHVITHFVSFPLISKEIKENFLKFQELVLGEGHIDGVDESIFQKVNKIHLTIGVLVLLDDYEKDEAAAIIDQIRNEVVKPLLQNSPLTIKMKGLQYMNDDPSQVDVLYSKVQAINDDDSEILQKLSDNIVDYFQKKGMMKNENKNVKLHATLINTRYRKDGDNGSGSRSKDRKHKRIAFDARPIMAKYSNFEFGEQILDVIHLSHRFSSDSTGYYEPIHTISCI